MHAVIRFGAAVDKCVDSIESGNMIREISWVDQATSQGPVVDVDSTPR